MSLPKEDSGAARRRVGPGPDRGFRTGVDSAGARTGAGGEWIVLSPDGERVATVRMPPGLQPTQITEDRGVGVKRTELGLETVAVHPLVRGQAAAGPRRTAPRPGRRYHEQSPGVLP